MGVTLVPDSKELAGNAFARVVARTRDCFPDPAYRPIDDGGGTRVLTGRHALSVNSDGTGTKPELAERLFDATGNTVYFERPAHDVVAMVADDAARSGHFTVGIVNCVDVNSADHPGFAEALARGMEQACRAGRFALLNGETAELGYRVPGPGTCRLNWNAVALAVVNSDKELRPSSLRPGQPIVALREPTIRSNGLSSARAILEHAYLAQRGLTRELWLGEAVASRFDSATRRAEMLELWQLVCDQQPSLNEQMMVPWHEQFGDLAERLSRPSRIYSPLVYEALGGVDGAVAVPLIACVHVTGGGIPLKARRMLGKTGLGARFEAVFPDPDGVDELFELAERHPRADGSPMVNNRSACEQWNRGIGFACVVPDAAVAESLVQLAGSLGYEAAVAGEILDQPCVEWRGEVWRW